MIVAPPGEPSARKGRPPLVTIVGAIELLGRLPPSTRFGCVVESKLKSVNSLLSRNPWPGNDESRAAGRFDRERVRDDGSGLVRRRQMGGRLPRPRTDTDPRAGLPRRRGRRDQRAPGRRVLVREQPGERHVEVGRIGEVRTVREGVARGLEVVVQGGLPRHRREVVALEDVQRLPDGRAAARRRPHRVDVEPPVVDVGRPAPARRTCRSRIFITPERQTWFADGRRPGAERSRPVRRRPLRGRTLRAEMRDALVRLCERGVREHGPGVSRSSVRIEVQRRARRDVVEPVAVRVHLVEPHLVDDVSVTRDVNRRGEDLGQRHRAVVLERVGPRLHRAGHTDRETAVARVVEGQGSAVLPQRRRVHRHRRHLSSVDRRDLAARCG